VILKANTSSQLARLAGAATVFVVGLAAGAAVAPPPSSTALSAPAPLAPPAIAARSPSSGTKYRAEVVRVIDGDTFAARVHAWPGIEIVTKIRLREIDAPEHRARCDAERSKAQAAHDALARLLAEGDVTVSRVALDKFGGRVLADATTRGTPDVAAVLLELGLVRPYRGGRRAPWCD
jgi:endonuclease YncB( thermonuclease family)